MSLIDMFFGKTYAVDFLVQMSDGEQIKGKFKIESRFVSMDEVIEESRRLINQKLRQHTGKYVSRFINFSCQPV